MNVKMMNFLSSHASGIDDCTKAIRTALLTRQARHQDHHATQQTAMLVINFCKRTEVQLGYQHEVHGRRRMNIVKRKNILVLVYFLTRDYPSYDFAEDAIVHLFRFPRCFFVNS